MSVMPPTAVPTANNLPAGFQLVKDAPADLPLAHDNTGNYWLVQPVTHGPNPMVNLVKDTTTQLPSTELRLANGAAILERLRVTLDHMARANTPFNQAQLVIIGMLQNTLTFQVSAALVWQTYIMGLSLSHDTMAAYYARQRFVRAWNVTVEMLTGAGQDRTS